MRALDLLDVLNFDNKKKGNTGLLTIQNILKETFGFNEFRLGQEQVITNLVAERAYINGKTAFYQTVENFAIL